jgi:hypothetical protein
MAAAKRRAKELKDGSYMVELEPGGRQVRVLPRDDFDANAFNIAAEAADPFAQAAQRRTARDLAPDDAAPSEKGMVIDANLDSEQPRAARIPALAESQEDARARQQTPDGLGVDTIYVDPIEQERRRRMKAAALRGARVREGHDVHFRDPENPVSL